MNIKKYIYTGLLLTLLTGLNAKSILTPLDKSINDMTNPYFPLIVGHKRFFSVETPDGKTTAEWNITDVYSLSDDVEDLNNVNAYKVEVNENEEIFYLINNNGFTCRYDIALDGSATIRRLLPEATNIDINWVSDNTSFIITEISNEIINVDYIDNSESFSGYNKYKINEGPFEMYLYDMSGDDKNDYLYQLTSSKLPAISEPESTPVTVSKTKPEFIEEIEEEEITEEVEKEKVIKKPVVVAKKPIIEKEDYSKVRLIPKLENRFYYIQVGSFIVLNNALKVCNDLLVRGFKTVVFEDNDSLYKVLIEDSKDMEDMLFKARQEINSGSFMKKRL